MAVLFNFGFGDFHAAPDAEITAGDLGAAPERNNAGRYVWAFDDGANEEAAITNEMPCPSTSGTWTATIFGYFKSETTAADEAHMEVYVEAKTAAEAVDMGDGASWDSANGGDVVPDGTAERPVKLDITLTNKDSVAEDDIIRFGVRRATQDAADTATGDFVMTGLKIKDTA